MNDTTTINDFALEFSPTKGFFDLVIEDSDFKTERDLKTAILISLFLDGRSELDDHIPNSRGGAVDSLNKDDETLTGSKIWLTINRKLTNQTLTDIELYAISSLEWIKNKKIASEIEVEASFLDKALGRISLIIRLTEPNGNIPREFVFSWDQIKKEFKGL